jgi:GDPmannose 4,6-dehydratase
MNKRKQKKAFITGITGQDGSYLSELLLEKGYEVYGLLWNKDSSNYGSVEHLKDKIEFVLGDLVDLNCFLDYFKKIQPDEIYNLGAQSHVHKSWSDPISTTNQTGLGPLRIFEAVRQVSPHSKVYQASSSELFGKAKELPQTEKTTISPSNPYASSKALAHFNAKIYRQSFNLFISTGIMFNHESPRRSPDFVTRKITLAAACIKLGLKGKKIPIGQDGNPIVNSKGKLELGNLNSKRDWGFAGDYVESMWMILQHSQPDDFIISTGQVHTVKQLASEAFKAVGLNWKDYVVINQKWVRPTETSYLVGDHTKITKILGWKPKTTFQELVQIMVKADLEFLA